MSEWIETKNQMPKVADVVLIWIPAIESMRTAYLYDDYWFLTGEGSKFKKDVTHWMPLPSPPKP